MESIILMNTNIDLNILLKKLLPFIIIVLLAMVINLIIFLFLPKVHFADKSPETKVIEYIKYKFKENFEESSDEKHKSGLETQNSNTKKEYELISNIVLKLIYKEKEHSGWIVISEKSSTESNILGVDDEFNSYRLKKIFGTYVVFSKNAKEYKLVLSTENAKSSNTEDKQAIFSIRKIDDQYQLSRGLLNSYTKDSKKIWKEISIREIKKNGKIDGFKILRIKNKSVFLELGLKQNDIIKSVNNIKLKSYADAFNLYKKIDKVKNIKFVVLRGDKEVELEYEIE